MTDLRKVGQEVQECDATEAEIHAAVGFQTKKG